MSDLRVGDKIRILKPNHWSTDCKVGDILEVDYTGNSFRVRGSSNWSFSYEQEGIGWEKVESTEFPMHAFDNGETIKGIDADRYNMRVKTSKSALGKALMKEYCDHKWTHYTGLNEVYQFCSICDLKRGVE